MCRGGGRASRDRGGGRRTAGRTRHAAAESQADARLHVWAMLPHIRLMALTEALLQRIVSVCSDHGMTERRFGLTVVTNHGLTSRLRAGYGVTSQTHDRIMGFIEGREPERESLAMFRSTDARGQPRFARSLQREAAA